ncbi:protein kinase domain protein [Aspergillus nomiae NRRL 13137]|uniref:non-specific serine/threonine protein kinase n=1 Tax=Aspergillus nomiae NRRL (strain ATCC 15546 / NRRL 13137 / CBS 260.88 / M93) TaxID=1509407 RepID=A0A0L1JAT3_ASPN3|nr:protein kinase domain protein [Aspergillus nomiae NRRL 13137]KNG88827.1 protein kinase domain protein [Aspergillus nomiae NRRL 13137]
MSQPRVFPDSGFYRLDSTATFEEETLPDYLEERYYPVHIGEVFKSRYQVITKLGFGSSSTVWLCRDLHNQCYVVMKVHVRTKRQLPEVVISKHLQAMQSTHGGEQYVRLILDTFEILGPYGVHPCLLYKPASIDIRDYMHCLEGDSLPENLLRPALRFVLIALDYLHQANIIHTDVQPNNVLLGIEDNSILAEMEEDEISNPCPRKQLPDRTIYATRAMPLTSGEPILADLGEARLAEGKQTGLIMPSVYRAPEVLLGMDWDNKVDIWGLGQMAWTLFEQGHLFRTVSLETETEKAQRIAEMISLLGPPPVEFLRRSKESLRFWDENGSWKGSVKIPEQSLEGRESRLETNSQALFLRFLRKTLRWLPEERPTAKELLLDEWLRGDDH